MTYSLSDVTAKLLPKDATASKATSDASGNNIEKTYVKTVNGVKPVNGNVTVKIPEVDTSSLVIKNGNRGSLSGYEVPNVTANALTINQNTTDSNQVTGAVAITVENGVNNTSWTKSVIIINASATITLGSNWVWSGGEAPTVSENCILVLHWCNDIGVANLVEGAEYLRTYTGTFVKSTSKHYIFIYRGNTELYNFSGTGTHQVSLAVGDKIWDDIGNPLNITANGIEFDVQDYTGYVTSVSNGFTFEL